VGRACANFSRPAGRLRAMARPAQTPTAEQSALEPPLDRIAAGLESTAWAAELVDPEWRLRWCSTQLKAMLGESDDEALGVGSHLVAARYRRRGSGRCPPGSRRAEENVGFMLDDTPGGRETIAAMVPPRARRTGAGGDGPRLAGVDEQDRLARLRARAGPHPLLRRPGADQRRTAGRDDLHLRLGPPCVAAGHGGPGGPGHVPAHGPAGGARPTRGRPALRNRTPTRPLRVAAARGRGGRPARPRPARPGAGPGPRRPEPPPGERRAQRP